MNTVRLSSKGQLVIPKSVRDDAQVAAGSQLEVRYLDGEIRLRPIVRAPATALDDVAGCLARAGRKRLSEKQTQLAIKSRLKTRDAA